MEMRKSDSDTSGVGCEELETLLDWGAPLRLDMRRDYEEERQLLYFERRTPTVHMADLFRRYLGYSQTCELPVRCLFCPLATHSLKGINDHLKRRRCKAYGRFLASNRVPLSCRAMENSFIFVAGFMGATSGVDSRLRSAFYSRACAEPYVMLLTFYKAEGLATELRLLPGGEQGVLEAVARFLRVRGTAEGRAKILEKYYS